MTHQFGTTTPQSVVQQLLQQAVFRILGPEGARRSRGTTEVFDLSLSRIFRETTIETDATSGASSRKTWTASTVGQPVIDLNPMGTEKQFILLPAGLVNNAPSGTTIMTMRMPDPRNFSPTTRATRLLQDGQPGTQGTIQEDVVPGFFGDPPEFRGETVDERRNPPTEAYQTRARLRIDEWMLVGYEWGSGGKKVFLDGVRRFFNPGFTAGTFRANPQDLWISKAMVDGTLTYKPIAVAFFAFWNRQLGDSVHRLFQLSRGPAPTR